jgi:hypothetical protein
LATTLEEIEEIRARRLVGPVELTVVLPTFN